MLLLVDDDPAFLVKAESILARYEQVYFARDAEAAVALMRTVGKGFTAALIDLDLPGVNGFDLIRDLKTRFPDLPVVAISGVVQEHVLQSAKLLGAAEVLRKPVTAEWNEVVERVKARAVGE